MGGDDGLIKGGRMDFGLMRLFVDVRKMEWFLWV